MWGRLGYANRTTADYNYLVVFVPLEFEEAAVQMPRKGVWIFFLLVVLGDSAWPSWA